MIHASGDPAPAIMLQWNLRYSGVVPRLFLKHLFDQFDQMGGGRLEAGTIGVFGQRNQSVAQNEGACRRRGGNVGIEAKHDGGSFAVFTGGTVENRNA